MRPASLLLWLTQNCCEATTKPQLPLPKRHWQMDRAYRSDFSRVEFSRKPEPLHKRRKWQTAWRKRRKLNLKLTAKLLRERSRSNRVTAAKRSKPSATLTICSIHGLGDS